MPIHPLPVLQEEEEQKALEKLKPPKSIVVRYGYLKEIGEFPYDGEEIPGCGTRVVVRTPRGVELATMLTTTCANGGCGHAITRKQMLAYIEQSGGKQYPFTEEGKVLRLATADDLREQSKLDGEKPEAIRLCKAKIAEHRLEMKLVDAEMLLGGERVVFYFMAEGRVDFRQLVRDLAGELHTRIEMRQVGARDEARLVADYEKCGQHCCCKQFLKVLKPVSMRNAKIQKATLDPAKISGRCGRLMCCLRYEEETYDDLRKRLPHRNSRVMTEDGPGRVVSTQILTQLALIELDRGGVRQAYPVENIEGLSKEQDKQIREQQEQERAAREARKSGSGRKRREPRRPSPGKPLREEEVESREGEASGELEEKPASADEAKDAPSDDQSKSAKAEGGGGSEQDGSDGGGGKKRRRRRRRRGGRKKRGGGSGKPGSES